MREKEGPGRVTFRSVVVLPESAPARKDESKEVCFNAAGRRYTRYRRTHSKLARSLAAHAAGKR